MKNILFVLAGCLAILAVSADMYAIGDVSSITDFQDQNEFEEDYHIFEFEKLEENEIFEHFEDDFEEDKYNRTAGKLCWIKLKCDFKKSFRGFRKSMRNCKDVPNRIECQRKTYYEFKNSTSRMTMDFLRCIHKACNKTQSIDFEESYSHIENYLSDLAEPEPKSNRRACYQKYYTALCEANKLYKKSFKECKTSECKKSAKSSYEKTKTDARTELKKCLKPKQSDDFEIDSVIFEEDKDKKFCNQEYFRSRARALKAYQSHFRKCKSAANVQACKDAALKKYNDAKDQARKAFEKCLKKSFDSFKLQPEEVLKLENLDFLIDETVNANFGNIFECKKKFEPELEAIRKKLIQDVRNCYTSTNNRAECLSKANYEANTAHSGVQNKIWACITEKL